MERINIKMVAALIVALASWLRVAFGLNIKQDLIDQTITLIGIIATIYAAYSHPKQK